jgi:imidazoleglycerol-phosphate dehydratase
VSNRRINVTRKTKETDIFIEIDPDQSGEISVSTEVPFLDHLLNAMAFHGNFSLTVKGKGDIEVDDHHLVEDIGLVLGSAFDKLVETHGSVMRFGYSVIPMDDSLAEVAIDVCGRPFLVYDPSYPQAKAGSFDLALLREFLTGFASRAKINLHANIKYGKNSHHMAESLFKALGKALKAAYTKDAASPKEMSAKGTIA